MAQATQFCGLVPDMRKGLAGIGLVLLMAWWTAATPPAVAEGTPVSQPDMLIRNLGDTSDVGAGVFNADGTDQSKSQIVGPGFKVTYLLTIQNAGSASDTFTITGPPRVVDGWSVSYYDAATSGTNITNLVRGTGWPTPSLGPGESLTFRVEISPSAANAGQTKTLLITATSAGDPSKLDAVKTATDCVIIYRPDLWAQFITDTSYVGDNVYNDDGAGQSASATVQRGSTATFHIWIQNDGTAKDSFIISGTAGNGLWSVQYYSATGT